MDRKGTWTIVALLGVAVIFILFISLRGGDGIVGERAYDVASTTEWANTPAGAKNNVIITPQTVVTGRHAYLNGEHVVAGEIPLPTPCHILEAKGSASEDKRSVYVEFVSSVKSDELCTQVITPARFKVTVKAAKDAKFSATLNGQEVTLNLIEASASDDLDNFELYIKG